MKHPDLVVVANQLNIVAVDKQEKRAVVVVLIKVNS